MSWLGDPMPEGWGARCGYLGPPFGPGCGHPADWHFVVTEDAAAVTVVDEANWILDIDHESVSFLWSCADHFQPTMALFRWAVWHPFYTPECPHPDALFREDRCIIPTDALTAAEALGLKVPT